MLLLGSSETLSGQIDLFEPINKTQRLFQRIGNEHSIHRRLSFVGQHAAQSQSDDATSTAHTATSNDVVQIARDLLLRDFVPAAVLINRKFEILCSYGPVRDFLALPMGASSLSLMDMVHDTYRSHLRAIIHRALRDSQQQSVAAAPHNDEEHGVRLSARPLQFPEAARGLVFVTFERVQRAARTRYTQANTDTERQLAEEHEATRQELHTTIQALEASNEDLKASNEEILSLNEELQSTNEELETSKEELQSVNEPRKLFAATRLTPGGRCGYAPRSTALGAVVELSYCLSGVRIESLRIKKGSPSLGSLFAWRAREDSNSRPCGS